MMLRCLVLFLMMATLAGARAQNRSEGKTDDPAAKQYFTDVPLLDQNGHTLRLYSDLLKGKVFLINSFFSTCENSCPRMAGLLAGLQQRLGDRLGRDVFILSFTVDPATDTPERLKAYAEQFHAKSGWIFLTGAKENVDLALHKFGQKVEHKENHFNLFIVGNEATGLWKKVLPMKTSTQQMVSADELLQIVDSVVNDQQ